MINTAKKAYLKSEGSTSHRGCAINYFTYSLFDHPNKFMINVNVELHFTQNDFIKTLPLDAEFDRESQAVDYGIEQGKVFIDKAYEQGKVNLDKTGSTIVTKNPNEKPEKTKPEKGRSR